MGQRTTEPVTESADVLPAGYVSGNDLMTPPKHKVVLGVHYNRTEDIRLSSHLYYVDAVKASNPGNLFTRRCVDP